MNEISKRGAAFFNHPRLALGDYSRHIRTGCDIGGDTDRWRADRNRIGYCRAHSSFRIERKSLGGKSIMTAVSAPFLVCLSTNVPPASFPSISCAPSDPSISRGTRHPDPYPACTCIRGLTLMLRSILFVDGYILFEMFV